MRIDPPAAPSHVHIAMTTTLRQLAALLLSTAILFTGNGLINTLLPVRAEIEAFSTLEIGLLGSVYFAGFILGCLNVPLMVRRVGHIRTFATLSSVIAATALAHVFIIDPIAWGVLRFFAGFAFAGLYVVIESWLNDRAASANRGAIMSAYTFISLCVLMAGQFLLTVYDPAGFEPFALIAILIAIALVPVSLTRAPEPPGRRPSASISWGSGDSRRWDSSAASASASSTARSGLWGRSSPAGAASTSTAWSTSSRARRSPAPFCNGARAHLRPHRPALRDRRRDAVRGRERRAAQLLGRASTTLLIGLSSAFGGFAMPLYAVSVAHANDKAEDTRFVATAGGLLLVYGFGASLGPLIASALMDHYGRGGCSCSPRPFTPRWRSSPWPASRSAGARRRRIAPTSWRCPALRPPFTSWIRARRRNRTATSGPNAVMLSRFRRTPSASRPLSQTVRRPLTTIPGSGPDRGRVTGRLWVLSAGLCMSWAGRSSASPTRARRGSSCSTAP